MPQPPTAVPHAAPSTVVPSLRRSAARAAPLLIALAAGGALAAYATRVTTWAVMTDELLYAKLATAITETGSPLPRLHGELVGVVNQLYPLLLAPVFGLWDVPTAVRVAHGLGALLMASAAVPAFLLARRVVPAAWAGVVALLAVSVPWVVLSGFLMSEVVAYPAFLWALVALERALARPGAGRDALALAAIGLAVLARAQFLVLLVVMPLAALAVEVAQARGLPDGLRALLRRPVLLAAYGVAVPAVTGLALAGRLDTVLGRYGVTATEGSLLPDGVFGSALVHLDLVALGAGLIPLLVGGAWALEGLVRRATRAERALAALAVVATATLALQTASFDLRFGGPDVVRDRYLFYVVPLLLACAAAGLRRRPHPATVTGLALAFALSVPAHDFEEVPGVWLDSPVSSLNGALRDQAGELGAPAFVAAAGLLVGIALAVALRLVRGPALAAALAVLVLAFTAWETGLVADRVLTGGTLSQRTLDAGVQLDWVDAVLPPGAEAGLVAFPTSTDWGQSAIHWWDVEFWNRTVTRSFVGERGRWTYAPFPVRSVEPDFATGRVPGTEDAPAFLVVVPGDPRFRLAGDRHAANEGLEVLAAERPYRATWATRGLRLDGWTRPGRPATLRIYGEPGAPAAATSLSLGLAAPAGAAARFTLATPEGPRTGTIEPGAATVVETQVCPPPGGHVDLTLVSPRAAVVPLPPLGPDTTGTRGIGAGLAGVELARGDEPCTPG